MCMNIFQITHYFEELSLPNYLNNVFSVFRKNIKSRKKSY